MNKEKQTYLSPETETLVVRFEGGAILSTSTNAVTIQNWQDGGTTVDF